MPDRHQIRLLVINQYLDTVEASGRVLRDLCEGLAEEMMHVTVVAGSCASDVHRQATPSKVNVVRARTSCFERDHWPLRAVNYITFLVSATVSSFRIARPDLVLFMTDPPVVGLIGIAVARRSKARSVLVVQDLFPEAAVIRGHLKAGLVVSGWRWIRTCILRRVDHVVAIGSEMQRHLIDQGVDPARASVIRNWIDTAKLPVRPRDNCWARDQGVADGFTVMYSGNIGQLQSLETLIEAAARLPDITFLVAGQGSARKSFEAEVRCRNLANLRLVPHQPPQALSLSLAAADVHLVSLIPGLAGIVEPSKLYGVLAAGRPVIAAVDEESEPARTVRQAGCGVVVEAGNAQALTESISAMAAMAPAKLENLGRAARTYAEEHCDRSDAIVAYADLLHGLCSGRDGS